MTTCVFLLAVVVGVVLVTIPCRAAPPRCSLKKIGQCISSNTHNGCLNYDKIIDCINQLQNQCTGFPKQVAQLQLLKYSDSKNICPEYDVNGTCWIIEVNKCSMGFFYHDDVSKYSNETCTFRRRNRDMAMACLTKVDDFCQSHVVTELINVTKNFMDDDIAVCNSPLYNGDTCLAADIKNCEPHISAQMSKDEYIAQRCRFIDTSIRCLDLIRYDCESKEQKEFFNTRMDYLIGTKSSCTLDG